MNMESLIGRIVAIVTAIDTPISQRFARIVRVLDDANVLTDDELSQLRQARLELGEKDHVAAVD